MNDETYFEHLAEFENTHEGLAPSCLKSRLYSKLIVEIEREAPLASLRESEAAGRGLCVFEKLIEILPQQPAIQSFQFCKVCHARVVGENLENAPIYWAHCPYCDFQNR